MKGTIKPHEWSNLTTSKNHKPFHLNGGTNTVLTYNNFNSNAIKRRRLKTVIEKLEQVKEVFEFLVHKEL